VKSNLQKLQVVKKVTKSQKNQKKKPSITLKQPGITLGFWWSNSLQPATLWA
jgi:hypothetical protein